MLFFFTVLLISACLVPSERELGLFYSVSRSFDIASFYLSRRFHQDPSDRLNSHRYLRALFESGRYPVLLRASRMLARRFPAESYVPEILANYYESRLDAKTAAVYWEAVITLDSKRGDIRDKLISLYNLSKNTEGLIRVYKMLINQNPRSPELYAGIGRLYALQGDGPRAAAYYKEWLKLAPQDRRAWVKLASLYDGLGDIRRAKRFYERMRLHYPKDIQVSRMLVAFFFRTKAFIEAERLLGQLIMEFPDEREFYEGMADLMIGRRAFQEALRMLDRLLTRFPEDFRYRVRRVEIEIATGHWEQARKDLETYHEKTGGDYHSYHLLGDVLQHFGDLKGSQKAYRVALAKIRGGDGSFQTA